METRAKGGVDALIECPNHVDIVIIGGGAMGSSIAYWLKEMSGEHGLRILVVEKDPTVSKIHVPLSIIVRFNLRFVAVQKVLQLINTWRFKSTIFSK